MFRALRPVALFIGGVLCVLLAFLTLVAGAGWLVTQQCAGRLHECYVAAHIPNDLTRTRLAALTQFAASAATVVFPVILGEDGRGLLVFDRETGGTKVIREPGFGFAWPRFSADGQHLILIRYRLGGGAADIMSCLPTTWRCSVLTRVNYALRSPAELEGGGIVLRS
jgi:hypothetical protein